MNGYTDGLTRLRPIIISAPLGSEPLKHETPAAPMLRAHDALYHSITQVATRRCTADDTPSERSKKFREAASDVIHRMAATDVRAAFDACSPRQQERILISGVAWHFGNMAYIWDSMQDAPVFDDAPDADDLAGSGYDIEEEVEEASL